ncbi:hypothetical protein E2986_13175 [Frieseomelitta varia]|uniref:Uncharacterized protein n=1 Tax=Frieseomelitta varia TaxID=561572 RepID=A0A833VIP4_9HYME|nr:hypothetical protein E2986_13175 [Frieseomelitta varia]
MDEPDTQFRKWILVIDVYHLEITRIWRHCFHRVTKATIDISTLVPSCNSSSFYMAFVETTGCGLWFGTVNGFIQSCMYSYYALIPMRFSLPKWIAMMLTMLQIMQMFWSIFITVLGYYYVQIA